MKKIQYFALTFAIAITGTVGFTACSSENDVLSGSDKTAEKAEDVHVNFVFNVATSNGPTTRMTSGNTQATTGDAFRGINNAYLATFKLDEDGKSVGSNTVVPHRNHSFGTILSAGALSSDAEDDKPSSRRVIELSLETGTNALMFWGKAIKTGTDHEQGKITMNIDPEDLSATSFSLNKIVPDVPYSATSSHIYKDALLQHEKLISAVLTRIVRSGISGRTLTFGTASNTIDVLNWSDYVDVTGEAGSFTVKTMKTAPIKDAAGKDQPMCALGEKLSVAFATWNTIHPNELRAGYGEAVAHMVSDLMTVINGVVNAIPVSLQEVVAQEVAKAVKTNVELFFDADEGYKWKSVDEIKANLTGITGIDAVLSSCDLNQFPSTFNLPLGSVILEFGIEEDAAATKGYKFTYNYRGTVDTYAMGGSTTTTDAFDPLNYMYPAELCYFGNSPIRVTDQTLVANNYPDGAKEWETEDSWARNRWENNGHVLSTTRSVAMRDNIRYGTALLKTQVRYGSSVLEDNNAVLQKKWSGATEANNQIEVTENNTHFVLTGVLIGGQEPEVGWNYIAKSATPGFGTMIYDKVKGKSEAGADVDYISIPAASAEEGSGNASAANYTLVWDNWEAKNLNKKQRDVYVALEFKNNSRDFFGENNLIRNGATFYIVGKLDPDEGRDTADLSDGIMWPTKYALPPYDAAGNSIHQRRVFIQHYMTTATFVIGQYSLQHALVSVPDLRSSQLSLGLSVDLKWQTGLNFDNIVLGE
jgi:hypothetical protein